MLTTHLHVLHTLHQASGCLAVLFALEMGTEMEGGHTQEVHSRARWQLCNGTKRPRSENNTRGGCTDRGSGLGVGGGQGRDLLEGSLQCRHLVLHIRAEDRHLICNPCEHPPETARRAPATMSRVWGTQERGRMPARTPEQSPHAAAALLRHALVSRVVWSEACFSWASSTSCSSVTRRSWALAASKARSRALRAASKAASLLPLPPRTSASTWARAAAFSRSTSDTRCSASRFISFASRLKVSIYKPRGGGGVRLRQLNPSQLPVPHQASPTALPHRPPPPPLPKAPCLTSLFFSRS